MENEETKEVVEETSTTETPVEENKVDVTAVPTTTTPSAQAPKNNTKIIIIILVGLLIIAGVVIAILLLNKDNKDDKTTTTTTAATVETVKITFDTKGGNEIEPMEVKKNEKVTLPTATKEGYTFVQWKDHKDNVMNDIVTFDEDTTLTAEWKEITPETKTIKVTFDSKGGSKVAATTYECKDDSVTIKSFPKAPTKDGYTFRAWEDKNGKAILEGAKLTCEDLKLYAGWDKKEEPAPTPTPKVEYTCPDGYTLDGTKCTIEGTVHEKCPSNTKADGNLCINTSDVNTGTRQCVEHTLAIDGKGHTWTGKGDYYMVGTSYGSCAYYKWSEYTNKTDCDNAKDIYHNTIWVSQLNACYAGTAVGKYETVCSSDYQYYNSDQLSSKFGIHDGGKCLKKVAKEKYCDDGYSMTGGSCVKTIDATKK